MNATTKKVESGDIVRLYGFKGLFRALDTTSKYHDFFASPIDWEWNWDRNRGEGFPASTRSVVEINGEPCPLQSAPLVPPADDYPHAPTFDYDDGPQELATSAMRMWKWMQPEFCQNATTQAYHPTRNGY